MPLIAPVQRFATIDSTNAQAQRLAAAGTRGPPQAGRRQVSVNQLRVNQPRRRWLAGLPGLGALAAPRWQVVLGWTSAAIILSLNVKVLWDALIG